MDDEGVSSQDGGIGRHALPPCTTIRRITTNLKQKTPRTARKSNCMEVRQLWGSFTRRAPRPLRMRISLPRHDLLGEDRWPISQRRRTKSLFLNGLLLGSICTGKTHQSLSGSKDQTIDNIQRTLRAYSESGSVS